jgi:hypothetical protein
MINAILVVSDSRSFGAAASHIACGGLAFVEPCCAVDARAAMPNAVRTDHKRTLFIKRILRLRRNWRKQAFAQACAFVSPF